MDAIAGVTYGNCAVGIGADEVALDHTASGLPVDPDAGTAVTCDLVVAHDRVVATVADPYAFIGIGESGAAGRVGADTVVAHGVAVGSLAVDGDTVVAVAGDHVALDRGGAANRVAARAAVQRYAVGGIAASERAGGVSADEVAGDAVASNLGVLQVNAGLVA